MPDPSLNHNQHHLQLSPHLHPTTMPSFHHHRNHFPTTTITPPPSPSFHHHIIAIPPPSYRPCHLPIIILLQLSPPPSLHRIHRHHFITIPTIQLLYPKFDPHFTSHNHLPFTLPLMTPLLHHCNYRPTNRAMIWSLRHNHHTTATTIAPLPPPLIH